MWGVFFTLLFVSSNAQYSAYYCGLTTSNKGVYWQVLAPTPCDCASIQITRNFNNSTRQFTGIGPPSDVSCCQATVNSGATYSLQLSADGRQLLGTYRLSSVCNGVSISLNLTRTDGSIPCFTGIWSCPGGFRDMLHFNADGLPGVTNAPTQTPTLPTTSPTTHSPVSLSPSISPTTTSPSSFSPTHLPSTHAPTPFPTTKIPTSSPTTYNACNMVQSSLTQGKCTTVINNTAPTPGEPPGYVVSVAVDLHINNSTNNTNFTFQLPINVQQRKDAAQRITDQGCLAPDLRCEWLNPASGQWEDSGCTMVAETDIAAHCDCSHLTVFSLVLRSKSDKSVLCQARNLDYVMLALFALMAIICIAQCIRLLWSKQLKNKSFVPLFLQHFVLVLICALRLAFLSAKPILEPEGALLIALFPTLFELGLLLYIGSLWTSINLNPLKNNNNSLKLKIPFAVAMSLCVCLTLTTPIFMSVAEDDTTRARLAEAGSYQMTVVTGLTAILMVVSGLSLVRVLEKTRSKSSGSVQTGAFQRISVRLTLVAVGAGICLLILAVLWAVAVSGGVMGSTQASAAVDGVFYCTEIIMLGLLLYLFQAAVDKLANVKLATSSSVAGDDSSTADTSHNNKWMPLQGQKSSLNNGGQADSRSEQIAQLLEENRKIPALEAELERLRKELAGRG